MSTSRFVWNQARLLDFLLVGRVDDAVERQARLLVRALDKGDAQEIAENRWILEDECGLRAEVRQLVGLVGW